MTVHTIIFCTDPSFIEALKHRFCSIPSPGCMEDIYDGLIYQQEAKHLNELHITFNINFDGAPKFKSSGVQVWPIQVVINELPPTMRHVYMYTMSFMCTCM